MSGRASLERPDHGGTRSDDPSAAGPRSFDRSAQKHSYTNPGATSAVGYSVVILPHA
jgi:hypothetical protein